IVVAGKATIMIVDALYLFPEGPQRLAAVGATGQGGDFLPIVDPNAAAKQTLGAEAGPEQIAAAQPDLVILKSYLREKLGAPIEALGIPVFYVSLETPEQYFTELRALGHLLGNDARAEEVISFYQERVERVRQRVADIPDDQKPRVLILQHSAKGGETAYSVPPAAWMQTLLVQMSGGRPVWTEVQGSGWTIVTLEPIAAWDPDQVYVIDYFGDPRQAVEELQADPVARNLKAVQSGQVFAFPKDTYSWDQPDTRWILGLQWLASHIHPDRFADLDILQEFTTFYRTLYRLDDGAIEGRLRPLLRGSLP
ncbi:MAG: ABC transporter substrate-binding protein, partial [Anaerolineae bacterium]